MSGQQIKNFRLFKMLLRELKSFGLNPNDWRIERTTWDPEGCFQITHRKDHQFCFRADWALSNETRAKLTELILMSI